LGELGENRKMIVEGWTKKGGESVRMDRNGEKVE
jgi:hypothetical protein